MASLLLDKVVKRFEAVEVIRGVDLAIDSGEFVVFVGPSGCGKSTLLRMIAGLETITDGALSIDGQVMNRVPPAERGIAMVFQSYALYPHMNVYKNMAFGLETAGMPAAEIETRVAAAADVLQITHLLNRKPKQLSGGQRQRVAIGRAIVREPKIFLFDEPLSNLDAELRVQMRVEIAKLHRQLGNTMIYVTHDQVEAMTLADKIVVLRGGVVEQVGAPLDLYNRPANQFVAGFIGSPKMNFLAVAPGGEPGAVLLAGTPIRLPERFAAAGGAALTLGVRPEHVLAGAAPLGLGDVTVEHVEHLGHDTLVYGRLGDGQALSLVLDGQRRIAAGDTLPVGADPEQLHLFDQGGRSLG